MRKITDYCFSCKKYSIGNYIRIKVGCKEKVATKDNVNVAFSEGSIKITTEIIFEDQIYVADSLNRRIQVFQYLGKD